MSLMIQVANCIAQASNDSRRIVGQGKCSDNNDLKCSLYNLSNSLIFLIDSFSVAELVTSSLSSCGSVP